MKKIQRFIQLKYELETVEQTNIFNNYLYYTSKQLPSKKEKKVSSKKGAIDDTRKVFTFDARYSPEIVTQAAKIIVNRPLGIDLKTDSPFKFPDRPIRLNTEHFINLHLKHLANAFLKLANSIDDLLIDKKDDCDFDFNLDDLLDDLRNMLSGFFKKINPNFKPEDLGWNLPFFWKRNKKTKKKKSKRKQRSKKNGKPSGKDTSSKDRQKKSNNKRQRHPKIEKPVSKPKRGLGRFGKFAATMIAGSLVLGMLDKNKNSIDELNIGSNDISNLEEEAKEYKKELEELKTYEDKLKKLFDNGDISKAEYEKEISNLNAEIKKTENDLNTVLNKLGPIDKKLISDIENKNSKLLKNNANLFKKIRNREKDKKRKKEDIKLGFKNKAVDAKVLYPDNENNIFFIPAKNYFDYTGQVKYFVSTKKESRVLSSADMKSSYNIDTSRYELGVAYFKGGKQSPPIKLKDTKDISIQSLMRFRNQLKEYQFIGSSYLTEVPSVRLFSDDPIELKDLTKHTLSDQNKRTRPTDTIVFHRTGSSRVGRYDAEYTGHYTIDKDGTVYLNVPDELRALHAKATKTDIYNDHSIGIEVVGNVIGDKNTSQEFEQLTPRQAAALNTIVTYLMQKYENITKFTYHGIETDGDKRKHEGHKAAVLAYNMYRKVNPERAEKIVVSKKFGKSDFGYDENIVKYGVKLGKYIPPTNTRDFLTIENRGMIVKYIDKLTLESGGYAGIESVKGYKENFRAPLLENAANEFIKKPDYENLLTMTMLFSPAMYEAVKGSPELNQKSKYTNLIMGALGKQGNNGLGINIGTILKTKNKEFEQALKDASKYVYNQDIIPDYLVDKGFTVAEPIEKPYLKQDISRDSDGNDIVEVSNPELINVRNYSYDTESSHTIDLDSSGKAIISEIRMFQSAIALKLKNNTGSNDNIININTKKKNDNTATINKVNNDKEKIIAMMKTII